jgi:hypothetical protein
LDNLMSGLLGILDRVVALATTTSVDDGGRVQMAGPSGGGRTENLPGVAQWSLPYFYSVAEAGVRGAVLRLLRGGIMVAIKHVRPSDAVAGEAGIFSPGGALVRLLKTKVFEVKGTKTGVAVPATGVLTGGGISLGAVDLSDGPVLQVVRSTDPVVTPAGIGVGTCQGTTLRVGAT